MKKKIVYFNACEGIFNVYDIEELSTAMRNPSPLMSIWFSSTASGNFTGIRRLLSTFSGL